MGLQTMFQILAFHLVKGVDSASPSPVYGGINRIRVGLLTPRDVLGRASIRNSLLRKVDPPARFQLEEDDNNNAAFREIGVHHRPKASGRVKKTGKPLRHGKPGTSSRLSQMSLAYDNPDERTGVNTDGGPKYSDEDYKALLGPLIDDMGYSNTVEAGIIDIGGSPGEFPAGVETDSQRSDPDDTASTRSVEEGSGDDTSTDTRDGSNDGNNLGFTEPWDLDASSLAGLDAALDGHPTTIETGYGRDGSDSSNVSQDFDLASLLKDLSEYRPEAKTEHDEGS